MKDKNIKKNIWIKKDEEKLLKFLKEKQNNNANTKEKK